MAVNGGEMRDCRFVDAVVEATRSGRRNVETKVRSCIFTGEAAPVRVPVPGEVTVEDNQIIQTRENTLDPYQTVLTRAGVRFRRNTVWLPEGRGSEPDGTEGAALRARMASDGNRIVPGATPRGPETGPGRAGPLPR